MTDREPADLLFVYGTLKRGKPNHRHYLREARFIGLCRTLQRYPLVLSGPWRLPALLDRPGLGHRVRGELFEVRPSLLAELDRLEGVGTSRGYRRALIDVVPWPRGGAPRRAQVYLRPAGDGIAGAELLAEYR